MRRQQDGNSPRQHVGRVVRTLARIIGIGVMLCAVQPIVESTQSISRRDAKTGKAGEGVPSYEIGWESRTPVDELSSAYGAGNVAQGFHVYFTGRGIHLISAPQVGAPWRWTIDLAGFGYSHEVAPVGEARLLAFGHRVDTEYEGGFRGWYENGPNGLEQVFLIERPPAGSLPDGPAPLWLEFALGGDLSAKPDATTGRITLQSQSGSRVLRYGPGRAVDEAGREMPTRFELLTGGDNGQDRLRVVLDARDAVYPVRLALDIASPKAARPAETAISGAPATFNSLAAPSNDTCVGAVAIPGAGPFPYTAPLVSDITDATSTDDPPAPSCQPDVSRSVWYRFTPPAAGSYIFSTCADGPTGTTVPDTVLAVYTSSGGCGGPFTEVAGACDDDSCAVENLQSVVTATLSAGVTYYVLAWKFGADPPTPGSSALQLRVSTVAAPPANDTCVGAEIIPGAGPFPHLTSVVPDITGAETTDDPAAPTCQSLVSRSVWYSFTPSSSDIYTMATCTDGPTATTVDDTVMALYTSGGGCAGPFVQLGAGCDDDSCVVGSQQSTVTASLAAGTTYYVLVWKFGLGPPPSGQAAVQVRVSRQVPPANDVCAAAAPLVLDRVVSGTTVSAADDYRLSGGSCFTGIGQVASAAAGRDVAYTFTAPDAGDYSFRVTNYNTSHNLVAYVAGSCEAGTSPITVSSCLAAVNRSSAGTAEEVMCLPLANGQAVSIFVDDNGATSGSSFRIETTRCARETEPNGTTASANSFACGMEGTISPNAEVDFFSLGSPPAGSRIFALVDGVAAGSDDFDLRVTTDADTLEYDDKDNDTPFGSLAPNVAGTPAPGVPIFLRVNHFSSVRSSEPYRLYAVVQPPLSAATLEVEPNGTPGEATQGSNGYFLGALSAVNDTDMYGFQATEGDLVYLGLDGDPLRDGTPLNGALAILDADGKVLLAVNDGTGASSTAPGTGSLIIKTPHSPGEALTWRVRSSGTYYARVTGSGAGDYLLSIARNCSAAAPEDADGDGVPDGSDCAPADPTAFALPGEVSNLVLPAGGSTLQWDSVASGAGSGTVHDVLRGSAGEWPVGQGASESCLVSGTAGSSAFDPVVPPLGRAAWYIVRGRNACGSGPWGFTSAGAPRVSNACP